MTNSAVLVSLVEGFLEKGGFVKAAKALAAEKKGKVDGVRARGPHLWANSVMNAGYFVPVLFSHRLRFNL